MEPEQKVEKNPRTKSRNKRRIKKTPKEKN